MFSWQLKDWPKFTYKLDHLQNELYTYALNAGIVHSEINQTSADLKIETIVEFLVEEAHQTSQIENEIISYDDLRSSIQNQLGLIESIPQSIDARALGIAKLSVSNHKTFEAPLTESTLFEWHNMLFSDPDQRQKLRFIGQWRPPETDPMQIVSGPIGREIIHYEAPPSNHIKQEMDQFIRWYNSTSPEANNRVLAGPVRAAIAHLYFEIIHPFIDGNGRIGRALAEKTLSQELGYPILLNLSGTLYRNRKKYYMELAAASKNSLDLTDWINYFVGEINIAQEEALSKIKFVIQKAMFWNKYDSGLNDRQKKMLNRMFREGSSGFTGGINAKKYMAITHCSKATATRDLAELHTNGCLIKLPGSGRSTRYDLSIEPIK